MEEDIKQMLIPKDPNDGKDVIMEIRAGAGGDESAIFAGDLFRMYQRYAEKQGWRVELSDFNEGDAGWITAVWWPIFPERMYLHI